MDAWRKRRSVFRGIWDAISENLDGKQARARGVLNAGFVLFGERVLEGLLRAVGGLNCVSQRAANRQRYAFLSRRRSARPAGHSRPATPPSTRLFNPPPPPPTQADLYEEMGVETDESAGTDFKRLEAALMPKKRRF